MINITWEGGDEIFTVRSMNLTHDYGHHFALGEITVYGLHIFMDVPKDKANARKPQAFTAGAGKEREFNKKT